MLLWRPAQVLPWARIREVPLSRWCRLRASLVRRSTFATGRCTVLGQYPFTSWRRIRALLVWRSTLPRWLCSALGIHWRRWVLLQRALGVGLCLGLLLLNDAFESRLVLLSQLTKNAVYEGLVFLVVLHLVASRRRGTRSASMVGHATSVEKGRY